MKGKQLLYLGFAAPIVFWVCCILCGFFIKDYNHFSNLVSELGALRIPTQYYFTFGLVLSAILNLLFIIGLFKSCKTQKLNTIPILFLSLYSFIAGPAIFPMPLDLHQITGIPFPFLILSPIAAIFVWRKQEDILKVQIAAVISLIIMILGFLVFFPNVLVEYIGLKQRFLYLGWTIWSMYLSYRFIGLNDNGEPYAKVEK